MKKPKATLTKWAPMNFMDIRRTEDWLERMAAQGLIFDEQSRWNLLLGGPFNPHFLLAKFRREEPKPGRRYRMVPTPKNDTEPSRELRELYEASGWHYVDFFDFIYLSFFLFETDDAQALEPYTDPESFSVAFRPAWGLVALTALIVIANFLWDMEDLADSWASTQSGWGLAGLALFLLILIVVFGGLVSSVLDLAAVFLLRRQVRRGNTRPTLPRWLFPVQRALFCFFLTVDLLIVAAILSLLLHLPRSVPLEDWEPDPAIQNPEYGYNLAEVSFSPLAVKQDLNQWTYWEEPGDPSASISIDYVDAVSPVCAGWVLDSWKRTDEVEDGIS